MPSTFYFGKGPYQACVTSSTRLVPPNPLLGASKGEATRYAQHMLGQRGATGLRVRRTSEELALRSTCLLCAIMGGGRAFCFPPTPLSSLPPFLLVKAGWEGNRKLLPPPSLPSQHRANKHFLKVDSPCDCKSICAPITQHVLGVAPSYILNATEN